MPDREVPTLNGFSMSLPVGEFDSKLAEVDPATSRIALHVDPNDTEHMLYLATFGIEEELLHGRHQQFGLARNLHLLKRETWNLLSDTLQNDLTTTEATAKIALRRDVWRQLRAELEDFVEGVDKFLKYEVIQEQQYFHQQVEQHATFFNTTKDEDNLNDFLDRLQATHIDGQRERIYNKLKTIADDHGYTVAETVAEAALDIPYLIEPLDYTDTKSIHINQLGDALHSRFESAYELVTSPNDDAEDLLADDELFQRLNRLVEDPYAPPDTARPDWDNLPLTLIQKPFQAEGRDLPQNRDDTLDGASPLGKLINRLFHSAGSFGGVIYKLKGTHDGSSPNWLINPRIAGDPVPRGGTYRELWQQSHVAEELLKQLDNIALNRTPYTTEIECPLCKVSPPDRQCTDDHCAWTSYVKRTSDNKSELVEGLRNAYQQIR